jgi:hypothetical protein
MSGMQLHYDGGLRRDAGSAWSYPYALIQVQPIPARGLTFDELERDLKQVLPGALDKATGELGDLVHNASIGSAVLDRDRRIIVLRAKMDVAGVGTVQGVSVGHLGSDAMVTLHCYALDADFEHYLPLFTQMNNSFQFDEGYEFKPAPARSSSPVLSTAALATGIALFALLGGSAFLVVFLARQARPGGLRAEERRPARSARAPREAPPDTDEDIPWALPADTEPRKH